MTHTRKRAIRYIEEDIEIHQWYVRWLTEHPKAALKRERIRDSIGDLKHHRKWIRRLKVIRRELGK